MVGLGFLGAILGIGEEGTYGTGVPRTKFLELNSEGLAVNEERLHSGAIPAIFTDDDEVSQGAISVSGEVGIEARYEGLELLIKHVMGSVSSAEVASFVVDATNNKLDFNIGAGQLTATIPSLTYKMGLTQATAASLCKAIYDAIVAAEGTGTYTVAFSLTTKKVTITRSAGTFQIMWNTGTNTLVSIGSLIGFALTADSTGGLTYTGGSALVPVFDHTFTLADALPTGLTAELDRNVTAFIAAGVKVNTMGMSIENNGFLMTTFGLIGQDITTGVKTSATLPTAPLITFVHGAISYGGSTIMVKSASFNLANNLSTDRRFIGSRKMSEPQRTAKIEVTGSLSIEFESTAQYDDFRAATSRAVILTFTGSNIKTGKTYSMTINFPIIKLTGGNPKIANAGVIMIDLPFKAYALDSTQREFNIVLRNSLTSI